MGSEDFNSLTTSEKVVAKATYLMIHQVRFESISLVHLVLVVEDCCVHEFHFYESLYYCSQVFATFPCEKIVLPAQSTPGMAM